MSKVDKKDVELLAEAVHMVWMNGKLREGWMYGTKTDKANKIHECLLPYDQLSEEHKESDRELARNIPEILIVAGYKMVKIDQ